jgi:hypothetical protein
LKVYDCARLGAYHVTIAAWHCECLFGEMVNQEMVFSKFGTDTIEANPLL